MLERLNMRVINICVFDSEEMVFEADPSRDIEAQRKSAMAVFRAARGRAPWIYTFDAASWEAPGFADQVIRQLDGSFADGALGIKIYKSIGMVYQSRSGAWLMPDNPVFDPIFEHIAAKNKTLYAHIADPSSAWRPPNAQDIQQYRIGVGDLYYMYERPGTPSKDIILQARDRMLQKHPKLRVVGCHLGCMEEDVDEIAKRFELYPNFAVDTGAFVNYLIQQPREKVRNFLLKYQDRILHGIDHVLRPHDQPEERLTAWENAYAKDWAYFSTDHTVPASLRYPKFGESRGLALPEPVLRKVFRDNAIRWVPGVVPL